MADPQKLRDLADWFDLPGVWAMHSGWISSDQVQDDLRAFADEIERLDRMRVHCENCGADYLATGLEAGCPCQLIAKIGRLVDALREARDIAALDNHAETGRYQFPRVKQIIFLALATIEADDE